MGKEEPLRGKLCRGELPSLRLLLGMAGARVESSLEPLRRSAKVPERFITSLSNMTGMIILRGLVLIVGVAVG